MNSKVKGFRLDQDLIEELETDSKNLGISVNNHVKNILTKYNNSYAHIERFGYQWFSKDFVKEILSMISVDDIKKLASISSRDLKNEVMYKNAELNLENIIFTIEQNCLIQNIPFNKVMYNGNQDKYTLIHNMGKNWNMLFSETLTMLMEKIDTKITIESNEQFVAFTVN